VRLKLSGPELGKLRRAIVEAYPGANALAELNLAITDNLENITVYGYVASGTTFNIQVGELLARSNGEGWLPSLLLSFA
jgi:Effector-associated domain 1